MELSTWVTTTTERISLGISPSAEHQSSELARWREWADRAYRRAAWRRIALGAGETALVLVGTAVGVYAIVRGVGTVASGAIGAAVGLEWAYLWRYTLGRVVPALAMFAALRPTQRAPMHAFTPNRRTAYVARPRVELVRDDTTGEVIIRVEIRDGM